MLCLKIVLNITPGDGADILKMLQEPLALRLICSEVGEAALCVHRGLRLEDGPRCASQLLRVSQE